MLVPLPGRSRSRAPLGLAALSVCVLALTGCEAAGDVIPGAGSGSSDEPTAETSGVASERAVLRTNVKRGATDVPVDTLVKVSATAATLTEVAVTHPGGTLPGRIADDGASWTAGDRLDPGVTYAVKVTGEAEDGSTVRTSSQFTTQALTLDQQTYPSVAPLDGETVGVGMPVVVTFDIPVTDKSGFERNMHVEAEPAQPGTWHWVSDTEAHWRPKQYWQAGTDVSVDIDVNGVDAGAGIYGQEDREIDFEVGDAHVYEVDAQTHDMKVFENGQLLRTIPITTGEQPDYTTRSGVKVIMEKFDAKRMNSETVGITGAEAYDIDNVQWAMRLTYSGEFIHAAPWSVGSQGHANVSHGCTGMSTENAAWLYAMTLRGDVVEYTGTDRPMEPYNGYGDWNIAWSEYQGGSAL
ncbi:MAG TPA: Ig-like domain-containing protein [Nocardioides sp.]|nr:Ig-like domain-containing protein [Nocardioides sp.]